MRYNHLSSIDDQYRDQEKYGINHDIALLRCQRCNRVYAARDSEPSQEYCQDCWHKEVDAMEPLGLESYLDMPELDKLNELMHTMRMDTLKFTINDYYRTNTINIDDGFSEALKGGF